MSHVFQWVWDGDGDWNKIQSPWQHWLYRNHDFGVASDVNFGFYRDLP